MKNLTKHDAINKAMQLMKERNFCEISRNRVLRIIQDKLCITDEELNELVYGKSKDVQHRQVKVIR